MEKKVPPHKGRILVVDDEFMICQSITELLKYLGYQADYVHNSNKALDFLARNPETDIILLDINLGTDLSGIEFLPVIREKNKYAQVIMFTSEDKLAVGVECMRRGAYDYMTKPFDEHTFLNKVPGALERKKILQLNDLYLGILFHDIKNPLQGIMAAVELLRMTVEPNLLTEMQKNAFGRADIAINQILMMINNIVSVSKFENGALCARGQVFILQKEVEEALTLFQTSAALADHAPLSVKYFTDEDILVTTDKDLFRRVLVNIVSNGVRYAAENSIVKIAFFEEEHDVLETRITNSGSYIEESARDSIFNKFSSVQLKAAQSGFQNYGLGLTFSKMAVEAMGGRIWITSEKEGPSTTFHFTVKNFRDRAGSSL
jgi:two-component system sensor histidine kinase/response regulator